MGCTTETCAMERRTICFPQPGTRNIVQSGDPTFKEEISRLYTPSDNNALEELVALKAKLRQTPTDAFWSEVTEGMSKILGAEMSFVMKRVLVDEQEAAVEMPPLGEPGACMMAAAFHYCAMDGTRNTIRQEKFHAFGCPCAYMRHDKVFLIPENLNEFITSNPNQLPRPAEAYIAVPLYAQGKCFGHFGNMWSKEGAAQRKLSWAFIEMLMHSLEDMMLQRFLEGSNFIRPAPVPKEKQRLIPHDAVTIAQSLRPYAGSLSHELRTPMQGVVGMLDVMYATVQESIDSQPDPNLRKIFEDLKTNIEVVQDSSRRAVEAADNVVHAYDMNMSVPEGPPAFSLEESVDPMSPYSATTYSRPEILVAGSNLPLSRPNKRRRDESYSSRHSSSAGAAKHPKFEHAASLWANPEPSQEVVEGLKEAETLQAHALPGATAADAPTAEDFALATGNFSSSSRLIAPGLRHTNMREVFQYVINEGLKMGGRPDSATAQETEHGESIEVRSRGSDGTVSTKAIVWNVHPGVPQTMFIDEKDLTKLISCVFLNAIKFTDGIEGRVTINAKMSSRGRYISIKIADNGPGIPAAFLPRLFTPFSQQNGSITRSTDGLGLGLMVAKGIARKLGGDLMCIKAETEGPAHGSLFEIKVPIIAGETISRPSSPYSSPLHRRAHFAPAEQPQMPVPDNARRLSRALYEAVNKCPVSSVLGARPDTPPSPRSHSNLIVPAPENLITSSPPTPPHSGDTATRPQPKIRKSVSNPEIDRKLAEKYPLTLLVAEDNKINRKLLVSMLGKLGYKCVHEAHDGAEAVRQMSEPRPVHNQIDVVLMDLWMPLMDGYEATERILSMESEERTPTILAVTADVTDGALERAAAVGMMGFMTKPYKIMDLQRLITEYCARASTLGSDALPVGVLA
ncbi:hypothetical protein LTR08_003794 [Meristemomyces frigidus]|nr:hypothetical protein LTR08_003794 [Meristemomyces frigidus]